MSGNKQWKRELEKHLGAIPPMQQQILCLRFGLRGEHAHTLDEVTELLGLSRHELRRQEARALKQLRRDRAA
ncbi:sigma factor-like helix-turn-helix DNA-binding protein [Streptomyces xylophagus]|uniref:sigma factor-like helix-turn-helix DNA-binding protein n=1 Tax=Streptomyces xylophagus TaxID=285514 RepID=UPI00131A6E4F